MECSITIYLDQRIKRNSGIYIVKLRVLSPTLGQTKMYSTNFKLSPEDFESARAKKPKGTHIETAIELNKLLSRACEVAENTIPFSFEKFEKDMFAEPRNKSNVYDAYNVAIEDNKLHGRIGNADNYQNSLNSIKNFTIHLGRTKTDILLFTEITSEWLLNYDEFMKMKGKSTTTVSMYLRALRAIFNNAIANGDISSKIYPFGKEKTKYKIPKVRKVKKTLSQSDLKLLFETTGTPEQLRAKAFFFFSYNCSGMNFKDIANLTYSQMNGNKIKFFRKKTENTSFTQTEILVHLTPFAHQVITQYGNTDKTPTNFIFNIINNAMSAEQKQVAIKNFTRSVNQGLKKLAKNVGINENISTYYARHSFSTNAIRNGASMELVSEQLGHSNLKTTQNYFSGFEDSCLEELTNKLMTF